MKISKIIEHLQHNTPWVDYEHTRDVVICGNTDTDVEKVAVCWVATKKVLEKAKEENIHFVITHENFLYAESTSFYKGLLNSRKWKLNFCKENDITVYRCHDGWDQFPIYGVADTLANISGIKFNDRVNNSFYHDADINMTVQEIAQHFANGLLPYGCQNVEILGDSKKTIHKLAMGVGAETNYEIMHRMGGECFVIADDGCCNWIEFQWCLDNDIPLVILHHSSNEIPGIENMANYLNKELPECSFVKFDEGYQFTCIKGENI